jgi:hypothetical protein
MTIIKAIMSVSMDVKLTNEPIEILRHYRENKQRCQIDIPGGESEVNRILTEFFNDGNTVKRLIIYKDQINKSKRKGEVPLYQFYLSMPAEEKRIYLVEKSHTHMVRLNPEEI